MHPYPIDTRRGFGFRFGFAAVVVTGLVGGLFYAVEHVRDAADRSH